MIDTHLNIIQWNLNGFFMKREELGFLIQEYNPEIICLQETNFKENYVAPIKNYNGYCKNRQGADRASGGIAIYIKSYIPNTTINIQSEIEVLAVQVNLKEKLTICNIYLPNQKKFSSSDIDEIIQQLPTPYIIFGDFNAHSSLWGSVKTDSRGKEIEKLLENDNIALLNDASPTHINISNGNLSCIDLTLCPPSLAHRLDWKVLPHLLSSDHIPIKINFIPRKGNTNKNKIKRWNLKKPNWPSFEKMVDRETNELPNNLQQSTNEMVETFTHIIINAANKFIGSHIKQNTKPRVPWWNDEIKTVIKKKKMRSTHSKKIKL